MAMPLIIGAVYAFLWLLQLGAYFAGTYAWLGIGYFLSIILGAVILAMPFTEVVYAILAFYGAYAGWGWPAWQAILLCAPFAFLALFFGGLHKVLSEARHDIRIQRGR